MKRALTMTALLLLAGCAESTGPAVPSPTSSVEGFRAKRIRMENFKATCMKAKGFKYTPFTIPERKQTEQDKKMATGDYAAMKAYRSRHGFDFWYADIYKKDEQGNQVVFEDPNSKYQQLLSETQQKAWLKASEECFAEGAKSIYHRTVKDEQDYWKQYADFTDKLQARALDGDGDLIALGRGFGDCLKAKGHEVSSVRPTKLPIRGWDAMVEYVNALAEKQSGEKHEGEGWSVPRLTPAETRAELDKEIKGALDDLECGKDFYAAYYPKLAKVQDRIDAEWGVGR